MNIMSVPCRHYLRAPSIFTCHNAPPWEGNLCGGNEKPCSTLSTPPPLLPHNPPADFVSAKSFRKVVLVEPDMPEGRASGPPAALDRNGSLGIKLSGEPPGV